MTVTKTRETTYGSVYTLYGRIQFTGSDVYNNASGGLTLSFAPIAKATRPPLLVVFDGNAGYTYDYNPGTTAMNGTLQIRQEGTAGSPSPEIPNAAVPAGVQSDIVRFKAEFAGML